MDIKIYICEPIMNSFCDMIPIKLIIEFLRSSRNSGWMVEYKLSYLLDNNKPYSIKKSCKFIPTYIYEFY